MNCFKTKSKKNKIYSFTPSYLNIGNVLFIPIGAMVLKDSSCCCCFFEKFCFEAVHSYKLILGHRQTE